MVKIKNFTTPKNKFEYVYVLTPTDMSEKSAVPRSFLQCKIDEYEALNAGIEALKYKLEYLK